MDLVAVNTAPMDVAHVELFTEAFGIGIAVEPMDAAIGGLLVAVVDDAFNFPREGRIGAALPVVVAGLREVPEVIDDAGADEGIAGMIECNAPGIAGAFTEDLKFAGAGMDAEQSAGEVPWFLVFAVVWVFGAVRDMGRIEDSVETIQPAIGAPGEGVGEFVCIIAAEAGDNDFLLVRFAIVVGVTNEEEIGRIGDPDTTVSDGDTAGDIEAFEEDGGFVDGTVTIGVFENTDTVFSGPGLSAGIFEGFGDPVASTFIDRHGDWVDDIGFGGDEFD